MRRKLTSAFLVALLVFLTVGADDCNKDKTPEQKKAEFVAYAKDIHAAFVSIGPLIVQLKPHLKSKWDTATSIAAKLIVAVEASNETEVVRMISELLPIFTEVAAEFTDNTRVLVALAIADIGLRFFVNHYKSSAGSGRPSAAGAKAAAFAKRPKWKCRSSQSGRYEKMSFCEKFPDVSVVETQ